ncbi:MAG: tetratricopeptide repeat protein [Rhodospirillaceae bacterium]|jgi:tetratricopeptide (TPR) repeat protein|nr:tetratricopeptide repeat protein [Rhodospirillaceae bacterium]MBT5940171.1 tetratricopeptide repeat protein [Rhodospirillaceae bacterium]MBT7267707.1 tetratricopeptide repeat protein [Rhodospirillaceae bacterium]
MQTSSADQSVIAAMQFIGTGQIAKAETLCKELLEKHPLNAAVLHTAGLVDYMKRDYEGAIKKITQAVQIDDSNAQYFCNLGEALRRDNDHKEALAAFERSIVLKPEFLKAHLGAGNVLRDTKKYVEAISKFRLALAINPNFAEAYHYLGVAYLEQENLDDAVPVLRKAAALRPMYLEAQMSLANALEQSGESEEALEIFKGILERAPQNVAIHNNVGNILKNLGRMDEAIKHYEKALEIDPDHAPAHYNLSRTQKTDGEENEAERMEEMLKEKGLDDNRKINLHFALGKIYDDLGEFDKAFKHFENGNDLDKRGEEFNAEGHNMVINRLMAQFNKNFFNKRFGIGSESQMPVFIVGVPRSGTTLVEQTLSSHPLVHGAGELSEIGTAVQQMQNTVGEGAPYPECVTELDAISAIKIAEDYLRFIRKDAGSAIRVTDKMPGNFLHLGIIALLFPKATIINCRRQPEDVALSCYFQHFTAIMPFSRKLDDLGAYISDYDRIMKHWHEVLPIKILDVQYEEMTADHESMSKKIVEHAGLEWDEACLEFHKQDRPVKTASSWQVRQPIYQSSVARWKNYDKNIKPLKKALGDLAAKE